MVFPIVGGNQSTGDFVTNSLRFNDDDSAYLTSGTLSSPNTDKFTVSFWVKISGARANIFSIGQRLTGETGDYYALTVDLGTGTGSGRLSLSGYNGVADSNTIAVNTAEATGPVFRDTGAWQNHVYAFDTGQGTAGNRFKWYLNGVLQSSYTTTTTPSQNVDLFSSSGTSFRIGRMYNDESRYMDGYLAEFYYVDGQQYDHTYFGEFNDNGVWVPVEKGKGAGGAITFGTNGFYLQFQETGTSANASGIGADTSGNGGHFTPSNLAAVDVVTDTPQNNFATFNPLTIPAGASLTLSEGNCQFNGTSTDAGAKATLGVAGGKWYWEVKVKMSDDGSSGSDRILVATENVRQITTATDPNSQGIWGIQSRSGSGATLNSFTNGTFSNGNSGSTGFNNGTVIGVALDADNGKIYFHKDGTYTDLSGNTGDPAGGTNPTFTGLPTDGTFLFPYVENRVNVTPSAQINFGGAPSFAISSGNSDANGHGNFEYAVPSGYYALNTKNLAEYG